MKNLTLFRKEIQTNDAFEIIENLDISSETRKDYKFRILYFLGFITEQGLNQNTLMSFKKELEIRADLSATSKNKYLTVARVYLKELHRVGKLPLDISNGVKSFKTTKGHKKYGHTEEEIKMIIEEIRLYNLRDKAIMYLLIFQGLRQCEISRLNIQDIDLLKGTMMIHGKGKHDKEMVHLHPETIGVLKTYVTSLHRKEGKLIGVSERMIRNIHLKITKKLGIKRTCHGTRHFFTTNLLKAFEGDVLTVKKFTRHESIEMLQVYNDDINMEQQLPTFVEAFENIKEKR